MDKAFPWRVILQVVAVVMFAGAAIVARDAAHWGWLIPAGLSLHAATHL